jgi:hypothetical protein
MEARYAFNKINTLLILTIFLISLSSCHSVKVLSNTDIPVSRNCRYILKDGKSKYLFENPSFENGMISGNVRIFNSGAGEKIYLYLNQDTSLNINYSGYININLNNISLVESRKPKVFLTTVIVVAAIVVLTPLKYLIIGGYDM